MSVGSTSTLLDTIDNYIEFAIDVGDFAIVEGALGIR